MMTQTFTDDEEKGTENRVWFKFLHHATNGEELWVGDGGRWNCVYFFTL